MRNEFTIKDKIWSLGTVVKLEQRPEKVHVSGSGPDAVFEEKPGDWWATTDTGLSFCFGKLKPDAKLKDDLQVRFYRFRPQEVKS